MQVSGIGFVLGTLYFVRWMVVSEFARLEILSRSKPTKNKELITTKN